MERFRLFFILVCGFWFALTSTFVLWWHTTIGVSHKMVGWLCLGLAQLVFLSASDFSDNFFLPHPSFIIFVGYGFLILISNYLTERFGGAYRPNDVLELQLPLDVVGVSLLAVCTAVPLGIVVTIPADLWSGESPLFKCVTILGNMAVIMLLIDVRGGGKETLRDKMKQLWQNSARLVFATSRA